MIASSRQTNVQQEFSELPQPTRAMFSIRDNNMTKICYGTFRIVVSENFVASVNRPSFFVKIDKLFEISAPQAAYELPRIRLYRTPVCLALAESKS